MTDLSPLGALVRRHDPDRFLTALFAPAEKREALFLLYAFNHELARAREVASEPTLALIRLHWWREVVEGTRRRHEVAGPLGAALDAGVFDPEDLMAIIDGREAETTPSVPTVADFCAYVLATAGGLAAAAGRLLGADTATRERLRALGGAYGLSGVLRSRFVLAQQQRCLLPEDFLGGQGLALDTVRHYPDAVDVSGLVAIGQMMLADGRGRFSRDVIAAALPAVLARRDLPRPPPVAPRGLGDRLAVLAAYTLSRV